MKTKEGNTFTKYLECMQSYLRLGTYDESDEIKNKLINFILAKIFIWD